MPPPLEPLPAVDNIGLSIDFLSMSFTQMQSSAIQKEILKWSFELKAGSHGSEVPSSTHVNKSQEWSLEQPFKYTLIIIKVGYCIFYVKIFTRTCVESLVYLFA